MNNIDTESTGEIIKKLRKDKHLTQEQLGEMIGVQKSAIAKYERGEIINLKRDTIEKLAKIFEVRPSYIMGLVDTPIMLNDKEVKIIKAYRQASESMQTAICTLLEIND